MLNLATSVVALLSLSNAAIATCNYRTHFFPHEEQVPVGKFGYTGLDGPLNWYSLNTTANELCAKGRNQSPINVNGSIPTVRGNKLKFHVEPYAKGAEFENLGTTLEVPVNGSLAVDNLTYTLSQFHFHTPSEHRIDLEYFPMELHFVFQASDKSIAVVAFMIGFGAADPLLTSVFTYVNGIAKPGSATLTGPLQFDSLESHLNANAVYNYSGSLTTPPCSEGVNWFISTEPIRIDVGTYEKVKNVLKFNARFTQNTLGGTNLLENSCATH